MDYFKPLQLYYNSFKRDNSVVAFFGSNNLPREQAIIANWAFCYVSKSLARHDMFYRHSVWHATKKSHFIKHFFRFIVQDHTLGAERLLSLVPLPPTCPINPSQATRDTLLELFRGLQHPYIHPVLDVEFWDAGAALISPLNPAGSLRDVIHAANWQDDCDVKYAERGTGLPLRTVRNNFMPWGMRKAAEINDWIKPEVFSEIIGDINRCDVIN